MNMIKDAATESTLKTKTKPSAWNVNGGAVLEKAVNGKPS
jgi:hypothetical protein